MSDHAFDDPDVRHAYAVLVAGHRIDKGLFSSDRLLLAFHRHLLETGEGCTREAVEYLSKWLVDTLMPIYDLPEDQNTEDGIFPPVKR